MRNSDSVAPKNVLNTGARPCAAARTSSDSVLQKTTAQRLHTCIKATTHLPATMGGSACTGAWCSHASHMLGHPRMHVAACVPVCAPSMPEYVAYDSGNTLVQLPFMPSTPRRLQLSCCLLGTFGTVVGNY